MRQQRTPSKLRLPGNKELQSPLAAFGAIGSQPQVSQSCTVMTCKVICSACADHKCMCHLTWASMMLSLAAAYSLAGWITARTGGKSAPEPKPSSPHSPSSAVIKRSTQLEWSKGSVALAA